MPRGKAMETASLSSTNSGGGPMTLVAAPGVESVPLSTVASSSCAIAASQLLSNRPPGQAAPIPIIQGDHIGSRDSKSSVVSSFSSILERPENEEEEERIEAELDEMARYIGPVAKSLFTPVVAPLVDANSFADALGVSPLYKQKESQRWSSALHIYRQMSTSDQNGGSQQHQILSSQASVDEDSSLSYPASITGGISGDTDENMIPSSAPARPINIPLNARQPNCAPPTASVPSARHMLSPPTGGSSYIGFMTPPTMASWTPQTASAASYVVSPPRRMSSSISPGESSLNSLELEAIAAVHELQFAVKDIYVSEMLPRTSELIFLNVTTLEGQAYCVELTMKGWRVTSLRHDCMNGDINHLDLHVQYFETIYALMDRISPAYRLRFTDALMSKLAAIQAERHDDGEPASAKNGGEGGVHDENSPEDLLELEQRQTFT